MKTSQAEMLLSVNGISTSYGPIKALYDVDIDIPAKSIVALVGANGAGKTTLLRSISGLQPLNTGHIRFNGTDISGMAAYRRTRTGIAHVPEGRQLFGPMSVEDNLLLGGYHRARDAAFREDVERMYAMFPILYEKRHQISGMLSGGQQQMLAIARALMSKPTVLLLDEPSMGLAPLIVQEIFSTIQALKTQGLTVFLVEQNAAAALAIADRGFVLSGGKVVLSGTGADLLANDQIRAAYLGGA